MRPVIIAFFVLGAFVGGLAVLGTGAVYADDPPKKSQWQYQCFQAEGVTQVTERSNKMGQQGWEMVTSAGAKAETLWCVKRPLWKRQTLPIRPVVRYEGSALDPRPRPQYPRAPGG
jgi:hypothetical protein